METQINKRVKSAAGRKAHPVTGFRVEFSKKSHKQRLRLFRSHAQPEIIALLHDMQRSVEGLQLTKPVDALADQIVEALFKELRFNEDIFTKEANYDNDKELTSLIKDRVNRRNSLL